MGVGLGTGGWWDGGKWFGGGGLGVGEFCGGERGGGGIRALRCVGEGLGGWSGGLADAFTDLRHLLLYY